MRRERCQICGREWPLGAQQECPDYRDGYHRMHRTNDRAQDVIEVDAPDPVQVAADSMLLSEAEPEPPAVEPDDN